MVRLDSETIPFEIRPHLLDCPHNGQTLLLESGIFLLRFGYFLDQSGSQVLVAGVDLKSELLSLCREFRADRLSPIRLKLMVEMLQKLLGLNRTDRI